MRDGPIVAKSNALGRKILLVRVAGGAAIVLLGFQQQVLPAGLITAPWYMNAYSILQPYLEEAIKRDAFDIAQWGKWRSCCGAGFNIGQGRLYCRFRGSRSVGLGSTESCTRSEEYNGEGGQHR